MTVVMYCSKTGHSKKLARAMADVLGVKARRVAEGLPAGPVDRLFLVGGIYGGHSAPAMLELARSLTPDRVGRVILATSCTTGITRQDEVRAALRERGVTVEEQEYLCRGAFLFFLLGHPNREECRAAADFALRLSREDAPRS